MKNSPFIKELTNDDLDNYFNIIKQLSNNVKKNTNKLIKQKYRKIYLLIHNDDVIGTGTIFFLEKYHCDNICLIEDIVIDEKYRKKGYGKKLIKLLLCECEGKCYKVFLDCKEKNVDFYKKCELKNMGNHMAFYFI